MQVRPFEIADIPPVVQLRRKCFKSSGQPTQRLAEARFRKVLFENPWYRKDMSSLVAVDETEAVVGFLGVVPRPMTYRGQPVWMAVPTQLMADPEGHTLAGVTLLQTFMNGPQDFSVTDLAGDQTRRIRTALGDTLASLYSLYWIRPLKPAQFARQSWRLQGLAKFAFRSIGKVADHYLARQSMSHFHLPRPDCHSVDIGSERLCALHDMYLRRHVLAPAYTQADLDWIISDLRTERPSNEMLRIREVLDESGHSLGWYLYCVKSAGAAQVLQFGGNPDEIGRVLAALFHDAYSDGAVHVTGRVQPEHLPQLSHASIHFSRAGPWVVVASRRSELRDEFLEGRAWLTRLEGEWWMNF